MRDQAQLETLAQSCNGKLQEVESQRDELETPVMRKRIAALKLRVVVGAVLAALWPPKVIQQGKWNDYLEKAQDHLGCSKRTACECYDAWYLVFTKGFEFATLANWNKREIEDEAHRLRGTTSHDEHIRERRLTDLASRTRRGAELIITEFRRQALQELGQLMTAGMDYKGLQEYVQGILRPDVVPEAKPKVLLDCGAWSAFNDKKKKIRLDVEPYATFLEENPHIEHTSI
jgi:hypothetical protein